MLIIRGVAIRIERKRRIGIRPCQWVFVFWIVAQCWPAFTQGLNEEFQPRTERISTRNGDPNNDRLKKHLFEMAKIDQSVRSSEMFAKPLSPQAVRRQRVLDRELTKELKQIVDTEGWPTIKSVGVDASEDAALILIHSPDHDFQRRLLPELQRLAEGKEIQGSSIAYLTDKILVSEGKLQRFGTQFRLAGGHLELLPVEDPPNLDRRRAQYLLPLMAEYRKELAEIYRVPVQ